MYSTNILVIKRKPPLVPKKEQIFLKKTEDLTIFKRKEQLDNKDNDLGSTTHMIFKNVDVYKLCLHFTPPPAVQRLLTVYTCTDVLSSPVTVGQSRTDFLGHMNKTNYSPKNNHFKKDEMPIGT